ncbi:MAG: helix-turn-helix domain-containing protein [Eubacteriales bacterium]
MFTEKLQKLRRDAGMSQETLAEKVGVSRQTVAKWENGDSSPDLSDAVAISQVFGVTLDELADTAKRGENGEPPGKFMFGVVKIGERGQIVIPKKAREVFGLNAGDFLMILGDINQGIGMVKLSKDMFPFPGDGGGADDE